VGSSEINSGEMQGFEAGLLGICFWRVAPETAVGPDRRAGKRVALLYGDRLAVMSFVLTPLDCFRSARSPISKSIERVRKRQTEI
jgi:hypothetical protein